MSVLLREAKRRRLRSLVVGIGRAPRPGRWWATCCAAFERNGESFSNQDFANVAAGCFQRSAPSPIIASGRFFGSGPTGTRDKLEIEVASANKVPDSPRGFVAQLAFRSTSGASGFRRIEADQSNVGLLVIDADCVAVDNTNVHRVDWNRPRDLRPVAGNGKNCDQR
jgi:hypothetical protein